MSADSPLPRDQTTRKDAALDVWREGDRTVIGLYGEHDLSTEAELSSALAGFCGVGGVGDVTVDLSEITFIDSTTITALRGARNLMLGQQRRLILRAPSAHARRILQSCGLLVFLEPTEATADQDHSNGKHGPRSSAVSSLRHGSG